MDQQARAAVAPYLHPGETINGVAFASNVVPFMARLVPILVSAYAGHHLLVATDRRLFVLGVSLSFLGKPDKILGASVLHYADLASATPFSPTIIGHSAIRLVRKDGMTHELMWPGTKDDVPNHAAFVASFPTWLQQRLAGALPPLPADPRIPMLAPPPLAGHTYLIVVGVIGALLNLIGAFGGIVPGDVRPFAFAIAIACGLVAAGAVIDRGERAKVLAMPMPERLAYVAKQGTKPRSMLKLALVAALVCVPVVGCIGSGVQRVLYAATADPTPTSKTRSSRSPSLDPDLPLSPSPGPAPVKLTSTSSELMGKKVMVRWVEDRKLYGAKITAVYGKLGMVTLDDKSWMWAELMELTPSQLPAPEPMDPPCGVIFGGRVIGAYINSHEPKWPARVVEIYHQRVRLRYDDGKVAWVECNDIRR